MSGFLSQLGARLNPAVARRKPLKPLSSLNQKDYVFLYKVRQGLSIISDSIPRAIDDVQQLMNSVGRRLVEDGREENDDIVFVHIQLVTNLVLDINDNRRNVLQLESEKLDQLKKGLELHKPSSSRLGEKDYIARANAVSEASIELANGVYKPDFHDSNNPLGDKTPSNLIVNPQNVVEMFGASISSTKFELNRYNRPGLPIYNVFGENNISAPVKSFNKRLKFRKIELDPGRDTFDLLAASMVLYNKKVSIVGRYLGRRTRTSEIEVDKEYPTNQDFYFASEEEYNSYENYGGIFAKASTAEVNVLKQKVQLYRNEIDEETGLFRSNTIFKREFYAHKLWDAFAGASYIYDQEYNANTFKVFQSWLSSEALERLFYRFAYFCLALRDNYINSQIQVEDDQIDAAVREREAHYKEAFEKTVNETFENVKMAVMDMYNNVKPLFRIQGQISQILGDDFVGTGRKRPTAVFKEIKLSRSLTITVMDPPQIANNACFRSAIHFINPYLVQHLDRKNENNLEYVKWFCKQNNISLVDDKFENLYVQNFVISEKLTELYHSDPAAFTNYNFYQLQTIEPELTRCWALREFNRKLHVIYALENQKPQLMIYENHVYIVAKVVEQEKQCHKCHLTKDLVMTNKHFLCSACLKRSLVKRVSTLKLSTWDSETFPLLLNGAVKHELHSITHSVSDYFSCYGKLDVNLINQYCHESGKKQSCVKHMLKAIQNQRRYELFLSRNVKTVIDDLNKKNEKGEYLISDEEALKLLCEQLKISNFEYTKTGDFLSKLQEFHDKEQHYALYAHNSAKFDSLLVLWEAMKRDGFDYEKFLPVGNSVLEFDFFGHRFLDSYKLMQNSLDGLCKDFKLGRFSKISEIAGVDAEGNPKVWKVKELFNLQPYYSSEEEYINLLKKYQVWEGFQKYGVLDTISLLIIMIFFIEAAMKITVSTLELFDWYRDAPEFELEEFSDFPMTNKQLMKYRILAKIFDSPCMTLGQLATKISERCSAPGYEKLLSFYGFSAESKNCLAYARGPRKGQIVSNSRNIINQMLYYIQQKSLPLEADNKDGEKTLSFHQILELANRQGGISNVHPDFVGRILENMTMNYCDISSQYPAVCLGPVYHHENHPGGFGDKLETIMRGRSYYPNYQGKSSILETTGQTIVELLQGSVIPTDTDEYYRVGNQFLTKPVVLSKSSCFTCCLDYVVKTNKKMYNIIGSRAGENIDWYTPNLMSKNYRKNISDEQFQALEARYGKFILEDYLVADEVKIFELIRYKFIFQISTTDYAVVYHLKTEKPIFYNLMCVCALGKEYQDLLKEAGSPDYNPSARTTKKGFMNILTGKKNQNPKKRSKKILPENASFEEENRYNTIEIINGKIAVYEDKISTTYSHIGSRIYSKSKQLLFYYLELFGWENIVKCETDGWGCLSDYKIDPAYVGPQMGQITMAGVEKMIILGRKCSLIKEEGQKYPTITFRGLCKNDALNYKLDTVSQEMKNEKEEIFSNYQWGRIFDDVLKNKELTITQRLSKRTLFANMSSIEVITTPKVFKFAF